MKDPAAGAEGGWVRIPRRLRGRGAVLSRSPNLAEVGGAGEGGQGGGCSAGGPAERGDFGRVWRIPPRTSRAVI